MSSRSNSSSRHRCSMSTRRVRRVGIDLERHVGPDQLAHETHRLEVPAGLDLELDADVPVVDVALDLAQQPVDGVEDADTDAARDPIAGAAEVRVQAGAVGAELGVEDRHLERRLGHRVPLDRPEQSGDLARRDVAGGDEAGEQVRLDHERRGIDVLRRVGRFRLRHAFAPPGRTVVARDADQQDVAVGLGAEAGAERHHERHPDATQLDLADLHVAHLDAARPRRRCRRRPA